MSSRSSPDSCRNSASPRSGTFAAKRAKLVDLGRPSGRDGVAQATQDDLGGLGVEVHVAAGREERELELHGSFDVSASAAEQRPVAAVEAELLAVRADEVQDRAERLAGRLAEPASELLEEQRGAFGWAQHEHGVDCGHVDTLVEQVDREHHADPSLGQIPQGGLAFRTRTVSPHGDRGDPMAGEVLGHESGVLDADAEPEGSDRRRRRCARRPAGRRGGPRRRSWCRCCSGPRRRSRVPDATGSRGGRGRRGFRSRETVRGAVGRWHPRVEVRQRCDRRTSAGSAVRRCVPVWRSGRAVRRGRGGRGRGVRGRGGVVELVDDHHVEMIRRQSRRGRWRSGFGSRRRRGRTGSVALHRPTSHRTMASRSA